MLALGRPQVALRARGGLLVKNIIIQYEVACKLLSRLLPMARRSFPGAKGETQMKNGATGSQSLSEPRCTRGSFPGVIVSHRKKTTALSTEGVHPIHRFSGSLSGLSLLSRRAVFRVYVEERADITWYTASKIVS